LIFRVYSATVKTKGKAKTMKKKECTACGQGFTEDNELSGLAVPSTVCFNGFHAGPIVRIEGNNHYQ
jgi:hypothetical protein